MSTARLTLLICVFLGVKYQETHKVPTYLTLTFFSFFPFFRHLFGGLLLVTLQLAMLFRNKQWMLITLLLPIQRCPANVVAVEYRLDERCGK